MSRCGTVSGAQAGSRPRRESQMVRFSSPPNASFCLSVCLPVYLAAAVHARTRTCLCIGTLYVGDKNGEGLPHGRGRRQRASGEIYCGEFEAGKYHGYDAQRQTERQTDGQMDTHTHTHKHTQTHTHHLCTHPHSRCTGMGYSTCRIRGCIRGSLSRGSMKAWA